MIRSAGTSGLTRSGSPPARWTAERIAARSTTAGTPVKSCMRIRAGMKARFASLTEADLAAPANGKPLPGVTTVAEQLAFLAFHESYHVGQLAYIRKSLGHSAVAG